MSEQDKWATAMIVDDLRRQLEEVKRERDNYRDALDLAWRGLLGLQKQEYKPPTVRGIETLLADVRRQLAEATAREDKMRDELLQAISAMQDAHDEAHTLYSVVATQNSDDLYRLQRIIDRLFHSIKARTMTLEPPPKEGE